MKHKFLTFTKNGVTYPSADFYDLGDFEEAVQLRAYPTVSFLKNPIEFGRLGAKIQNGLIISGKKGMGKVTLARAIPTHAGVPFIEIDALDLINYFLDDKSRNFSQLLSDLKELKVTCFIIHNFDLFNHERYVRPRDHKERRLAGILKELYAFLADPSEYQNLMILGVNFSNHDLKYIRNEYFQAIELHSLNITERNKFIAKCIEQNELLANNIGDDVHLENLGNLVGSESREEIKNWINQAAILATIEGAEKIDMRFFAEAMYTKDDGDIAPQLMAFSKDKNTAEHEAAHALVAHLLGGKVYSVSMIPHEYAYGVTRFRITEQDEDAGSESLEELLNDICMSLAPIAGESIRGEHYTGHGGDNRSAVATAKQIIKERIMDFDGDTTNEDEKVEAILKKQQKKAEFLLRTHNLEWKRITAALLKYKYLDAEDFKKVILGESLNKNPYSPTLFQLPPRSKVKRAPLAEIEASSENASSQDTTEEDLNDNESQKSLSL